MPRKTKKQKLQSAKRAAQAAKKPATVKSNGRSAKKSAKGKASPKHVEVVLQTPKKVAKKKTTMPKYAYKQTEYDKKLRKYTIQDISKTSVIIVGLFVMQYVLYLRFGS